MENLVKPWDCIDYSDSDSILVCLTLSKNKEIQWKNNVSIEKNPN